MMTPKGERTFAAKPFDAEAASAMLDRGQTQMEVATVLGVSQSTVSRFARSLRGIPKPVTAYRAERAQELLLLARTMNKNAVARKIGLTLHEVAAIGSYHGIEFNDTEG